MFPFLGTRQAVLFVFVFLAHGQVALDNNCLGNTRAPVLQPGWRVARVNSGASSDPGGFTVWKLVGYSHIADFQFLWVFQHLSAAQYISWFQHQGSFVAVRCRGFFAWSKRIIPPRYRKSCVLPDIAIWRSKRG